MKKAAVVAGIKKNVHPHVMRASAITHHMPSKRNVKEDKEKQNLATPSQSDAF